MDVQSIMSMNCEALRAKLGQLGLDTTGLKQVLQGRLLQHFGHQTEGGDAESSSSEYREVDAGNPSASHYAGPVFTLKDIAESLSSFSGNDSPNVLNWIEEFEENAETVGWNSIQKFIYAKQLLRGAAKLFVRSQSGLKNWDSLKTALIEEFGETLSAANIHKLLRSRRKNQNETYREYLYALMEIGKPIDLDVASLLDYFVEGIPDSRFNKAILYQAKTVEQMKENIKIYEKIRASFNKDNRKTQSFPNTKAVVKEEKDGIRKNKNCFKCGSPNHLAKDCKEGQFKCFKCNGAGHRASDCKVIKPEIKQERSNINMFIYDKEFFEPGMLFKKFSLGGIELYGLIDTGCNMCTIRCDVFERLDGKYKLIMEQRRLKGAGAGIFYTQGYFETPVVLDGFQLKLRFYLVRAEDIGYPVILGNNVLQFGDLICTEDGVKFVLKAKNSVDNYKDDIQQECANTPELMDEFREVCLNIEKDEEKILADIQHLTAGDQKEINRIIKEYNPRRINESPVSMKLLLKDDVPVAQGPRRTSYEDQKIIDRQVKEWLEQGIIVPSSSEYSSPVVLVPKKDGSKRLCCDYRKLNEKILRDNFPMVLMDDVLERLQQGKVFTTLDLKDGFFHVPVDPESTKYTAFVTRNGQYEFKFVPFGISNSPAVFCRFINAIFRDLIAEGIAVAYMDDLIIPSQDETEGVQKLIIVLKVAEKNGLHVRWRKCQFLQRKVNFLGYIIENGTIRPSREKTMAIDNFPLPNDKKSMQRFLGLTSYFRRFVEGYATIAKPMSDLLRKGKKFKIDDEVISSFKQLKLALTKDPVLKLYNPKALTEVHTDASKFGYGAVLLQKNSEDQSLHPVQYMSRKTSPAEEKYHSYELEVLAIIEALKKWRIYLIGTKFKIVTDCNTFAMTMRKSDVPLRVSRWAIFLQDFNYEIEHRSGTKMRHVDALSRMTCLLIEDTLRHRLKEAQLEDSWVRAVRQILEKDHYEDYYIHHDILYKDPTKELIVVPAQMEDEIIAIAHRKGHFGNKKTQEYVEKYFYIPNLHSKVGKIVMSCVDCIITNSKAGKKEGLLNPIDKEDQPLGTYHVDHVGPMTATKKQYNHIFVVIDAFSKFVWLYPTKDTGSDAVIDRLERQSAVFGNPKRIISDRGTAFTSNAFKDYCNERRIQHLLISTGVPRGNGQVERMHRIIVPMLAKLSSDNPNQWYRHVSKVQQYINSTPPRSTQCSPFTILTGCEMRLEALPELKEIIEDEAIKELQLKRSQEREAVKENIAKIQEENRRNFNKGRRIEESYELNDLVAIKRTQFGVGLKLKAKYFGPYKIIRKMNRGRYEVEKVGEVEGPKKTFTIAENMKRWVPVFESNTPSGRPNVGLKID